MGASFSNACCTFLSTYWPLYGLNFKLPFSPCVLVFIGKSILDFLSIVVWGCKVWYTILKPWVYTCGQPLFGDRTSILFHINLDQFSIFPLKISLDAVHQKVNISWIDGILKVQWIQHVAQQINTVDGKRLIMFSYSTLEDTRQIFE